MCATAISGIYRIGLGNGWYYIGSSSNIHKRIGQHRLVLEGKNHNNKRVQNCWNKYRVFESEVLEVCGIDVLLEREQHHLDIHFNNPKNVNTVPIAGNITGYRHTAATKKKMSGRPRSAAVKTKISEAHKVSPVAIANRVRLCESNRGRPLSMEHRANLSKASKSSPAVKSHLKRLSDSQRGVPLSDSHKAKLSAAVAAYWARERNAA